MKIKPTHYQTQIKIFEMAGCEYSRTKGDHLIYHYPDAMRPVVIPKFKEVPTLMDSQKVTPPYTIEIFIKTKI